MRQDGPEFSKGWRKAFVFDGLNLLIEAIHHPRPRMPRGSEIMNQMARGRPVTMVNETDYEWSVVARGRRICTLRQYPNGTFYCGNFSFPRVSLVDAAGGAARKLAPGLFTALPAEPPGEDPAESPQAVRPN
jgi:hypothetical protein